MVLSSNTHKNSTVILDKPSILCNYGFHEKLISIIIKSKMSYFRKQEGQYGFSEWVSEWVSDCCLMPIQHFSAISWREQVNFQWDDDDVRFVLDQHAELDIHSASSLKQQSAGKHVAPLGHIILIPSQQSLCSFSLKLCA